MGAWRGQKSDDVGHLLGGPQTAHREAVADIVIKIFLIGEAVAIPALPATRIDPGDTVFTRIPCGTNSSAQRSVSKISAAFAAPYCPDIASCGDQPEIDATFMTAAPVRPFICGSASRIIRTVWIRFRSMALRQS